MSHPFSSPCPVCNKTVLGGNRAMSEHFRDNPTCRPDNWDPGQSKVAKDKLMESLPKDDDGMPTQKCKTCGKPVRAASYWRSKHYAQSPDCMPKAILLQRIRRGVEIPKTLDEFQAVEAQRQRELRAKKLTEKSQRAVVDRRPTVTFCPNCGTNIEVVATALEIAGHLKDQHDAR